MLIKIIFHHELRTMIWLFCMFYCPKAVVTWMVHSMFKLYSFVPIPKWINSRVLFPFFFLFFKRDQFVLHTFAHSLSRRGFWCAFWSLWIVKTQLLVGWLSVCDFQQRSMHWEHSRMTDRQRGRREREKTGVENGWLSWHLDEMVSAVCSLSFHGGQLFMCSLCGHRDRKRDGCARETEGGRVTWNDLETGPRRQTGERVGDENQTQKSGFYTPRISQHRQLYGFIDVRTTLLMGLNEDSERRNNTILL